jgi:predicted ATP-dependent protease
VLPIGGLKSKILAAHLSGAKVVILPKKNEKDLTDVPDEVRKKMKLVLVENMDQVLSAALRRKPRPLKPNPTVAKAERQSTNPGATTKTRPVFPPEQPPAVA